MFSKNFFLILISLLLFPLMATGAPTITCHCFTDRSYDAAHPAKTDPYFLVTTQNSFFAALFVVDKTTVVIKKQSGTSNDDLWIAYWLASRSGISADILLRQRSEVASWREVVAGQRISFKKDDAGFQHELQNEASSPVLAQIIVDTVLLKRRLLTAGEIAAMRTEFAGNQEMIIAALIANNYHKSAVDLYRKVIKGDRSWGMLLLEANINPARLQHEVDRMFEK